MTQLLDEGAVKGAKHANQFAPVSDADREAIRTLWGTKSTREIADHLGRSYDSVYNIAYKMGLKANPLKTRVVTAPTALTQRITARLQNGQPITSFRAVAAELGCGPHRVLEIARDLGIESAAKILKAQAKAKLKAQPFRQFKYGSEPKPDTASDAELVAKFLAEKGATQRPTATAWGGSHHHTMNGWRPYAD